MGNTTSHISLNVWYNPRVERVRTRVPIRLVLDGLDFEDSSRVTLKIANNPKMEHQLFQEIIKTLQPDQRIIVLRMLLFYFHNEFCKDIPLQIRSLFPRSEIRTVNEESTHPDYTGTVRLYFPASTSGQPSDVDALLYKPLHLKDESIIKYAGLEDAMLNPRTRLMPDTTEAIEVFAHDDPLIEFIVNAEELLNIDKKAMQTLTSGGKTYYKIESELLENIRGVFRDAVFQDFRYTEFEETKLNVELSQSLRDEFYKKYKDKPIQPTLFFVIELSYVVITPGEPKLNHKELILK